jgi:TPR repeat protein
MPLLRLALLCMTLGVLGQPAFAAETATAACNRLAANSDDADYKGKGTSFDKIDVSQAEPACRKALSENADDRHLMYTLGRVLWKKEDYPGTIAQFDAAIAKGSTIAMIARGRMYEDGEGGPADYAKAADFYKQALAGGHQLANTNLAYLYEVGLGLKKDIVEAERLFREAIKRGDSATIAEARNGIAWMWTTEQMRLPEAEALAKLAVSATKDSDSYAKAIYLDTLAWARHLLGRDAEAVKDSEKANTLAEQAGMVDRLGDIYLALGRKADARAQWEKALKLPVPGKIEDTLFDPALVKAKLAKLG